MIKKPAKTLLLVEDEAIIALSETQFLKNEGFNVVHVYSGQEAVEILNIRPCMIDLILMDIDLGKGTDGIEAARNIFKNYDIPLIFLSSHTESDIFDEIGKINFYGYVAKNSCSTALLIAIKTAFRLHEEHRALNRKEKALRLALRSLKSFNKDSLAVSGIGRVLTGHALDFFNQHEHADIKEDSWRPSVYSSKTMEKSVSVKGFHYNWCWIQKKQEDELIDTEIKFCNNKGA
jgi:CheY-like chemotaxis protein